MPPEDPNSSDEADASMRVEHQYDSDTPPSIAIVEAIATIENVDPMDSSTDLGITLYDHVDPTALDQLVTENSGDSALTVDLTVHNDYQYDVRVLDSGCLVIERMT